MQKQQYIIRRYGQSCNSQRDVCSQNSKCIDGICKCSTGLTFTPTKQICELLQSIPIPIPTLSPTPVKYNEIITQPPRIPLPYNNLPVETPPPPPMTPTTTEISAANIAGKRIPLGGRCVVGYDLCPQMAHCLMGLCVCQPGKMFRDGKCFNRKEFIYHSLPIMKSKKLDFDFDLVTIWKTTVSNLLANDPLPISKNSNPNMLGTKLEPIPFASENRPLIRHTIGESCDEPEDCLYGSACQSGTCVCPISTVQQEGKCIKVAFAQGIAQPGESCENGELCSGGAMCDYGMKKCICAAGHDGTRGTCIRSGSWSALPGESCRNKHTECVGGSGCANNTCTCDGNHYAVDGYCRPLASPNINVEYLPATGLRFSSNPTRPKQRATRCNPEKCQLPTCFCSMDGRKPPGNLDPTQIPQFIVLTFDDAVNGKTAPNYKELFETPKYKNPNGCPIKATFFVSHEWTNYDEVQWIARGGHELASNSISHSNLQGASATTWLNEMDGMRRVMAKFGNVPEEEIVGIRAPQLAPGGDKQFDMMQRSGFLYDNSISANPGKENEPYWPQTLDHKLSWSCQEDNCPKRSFPGIWEVPMNQFYGTYLSQIQTYKRSSMLRAAVELNSTVEELLHLFCH
uniref:EGF-like domain-containing protein n=1 Tax=Panagrolaimus superbus TaxID=310955 RepID=A0A914XZ44_9BILA